MEIEFEGRGYAIEDAVVSPEWLSDHLDAQGVRIFETNTDSSVFGSGHIPGSVQIELTALLCQKHEDGREFGDLMSNIGVTPETQLVFYGDNANLLAAESLWTCVLFGHTYVKLLEGGRERWIEEGRQVTHDAREFSRGEYEPLPRDDFSNRASLDDVLQHLRVGNIVIDVRSREEYDAVHAPGAANVFWRSALDPDTGAFKNYEELITLYGDYGPDEDVIVYGDGGCHAWFVLKYLLGFPNVRVFHGFDPTSFPAR